MMALVRGWLLSITGAAILAALAESLMPEGGVKQVGKLACGLVLLFAVLQPLSRGEGTETAQQLGYDGAQIQQQAQQLQEEADMRMRAVIEEEMTAYSMDKAAQMGIDCRMRIVCVSGEGGVFLPDEAQVWGAVGEEEQQALRNMLHDDLGLEAGQVLFWEGEGP